MDLLNSSGVPINSAHTWVNNALVGGRADDTPIADEDTKVQWSDAFWSRWLNVYEQWRHGAEPSLDGRVRADGGDVPAEGRGRERAGGGGARAGGLHP